MLIESFEHAEADFEARLLIEARNEAETVIHATEKSLRRPDFAQLAGRELAAGRARAHRGGARRAEDGDRRRPTARLIHAATHALNHATQHLAEVMMNRSVREALAGKNVNDV